MIKEIKQIVRKAYHNKKNPFPPETFESHIIPTVKYAKTLAKKLNADVEICEISAWLHDIGLAKGDLKTHNITGAKEAEKILKKLNYSNEKIEEVKHCILAHITKGLKKGKTLEAKILASADAMSHFDGIAEIYWVAFRVKKLDKNEGKKWVKKKLEDDWKKLLPEAKEIVKEKYNAMKLLLDGKDVIP